MKPSHHLNLTAALAVTIMLGACSSTPPTPAVAPASISTTAAEKSAVPAASVAAPVATYLDPASPLYQKRSIYFDFDQYSVKPDFAPVLELHGKFLASHPTVAIKIQGNTDEQGGAEYNLALGQRRAESVVKALKIYGVKDSQMEAVSFGKEKPKASGHDEASNEQNRRADLAYPEK